MSIDSVFELPIIRLKDDPEIPFFDTGDVIIFRFEKPIDYRLSFKKDDFFSNINAYDTRILATNVEVSIKTNLDKDQIDLSGLQLDKPLQPMGLMSLRCEVIKSKDIKNFVFDIPIKIAFSSDIPSFRLVADKEFLVNNRVTKLPDLILMEDSLLQTIKRGNEVLIKLPSMFDGVWDKNSINKIRFSGTAAKKVKSIQYKDPRTLAISIKEDFQTLDKLNLGGIAIGSINTISDNWEHLVLELKDNNKNIIRIDLKNNVYIGFKRLIIY